MVSWSPRRITSRGGARSWSGLRSAPPRRLEDTMTCQLAVREGEILIGGQRVPMVSHPDLPLRMFLCPQCQRGYYRLYEHGRTWACRKCHRLDYSSRHLHRTVPNYARLLWLRRRLGLEVRPFAPVLIANQIRAY